MAVAGAQRVECPGVPDAALWLADLDARPYGADTLSAAEHERAARFVFERDRRRYLAAHTLLRHVLAHATNEPPGRLRIGADAHGKPVLPEHPGTHFNLSHSAQWALVGVAREEIGVDIEALHEVKDVHDLAGRYFTPSECAQLAAAPPSQQSALFLSCWTRKEACLKAIGLGLSVEPGSFEAGVQAEPREVEVTWTQSPARALSLWPLMLPEAVVGSLALLRRP